MIPDKTQLYYILFPHTAAVHPAALEDPIFAVNPPKLAGLYWDEHDNIFLPINRNKCYSTQEKKLLKEFYLTQLSQCVHQ